ncbi:MAG: glycerate dehydrogenase [Marivirga sp.]|nr:glycerate dehydrogenase [Marivirga sp.]
MKIIVTDGYTLNPGDLSWSDIKSFGDVVLYDRTPAELLHERCSQADIILTNKVALSANLINDVKNLKLVCVTATGYNIVDTEAARKKDVLVCNVPDYGTASVAQHTIALLLELSNRVGINSASVRQGDWQRSQDFCYSIGNLTELSGKTFGIIGLGKIGEKVASLAKSFDMNVLYFSRSEKSPPFAKYVDLKTLFATSDVISLHCPVTKENQQFVNRDLLSLVKPTAWIINTSRGQLINEYHLADALNTGKLAAAALDVLSVEPPPATNPLLQAKNCTITPHTAWMSREARQRIMTVTTRNIESFLKGKPINVVST